MTLTEAYQAYLAEHSFEADPAQLALIARLEQLRVQLAAPAPSRLSRLLGAKPQPASGLYIWGGVGRGKTAIMDLFFDAIETERKARFHFHRFMQRVHAELDRFKERSDPLDLIAERLAKDWQILCFDEFFVSDIADAMLLGRLLDALFQRGVILVATSNSQPADLYKDGLQRSRFLPAIALLEQHCEIWKLETGTDYRLRTLRDGATYKVGNAAECQVLLDAMFRNLATGRNLQQATINVQGREIPVIRLTTNMAWFDFDALCDGPRATADYIELAQRFQTVFISHIDVLDGQRDDATRRFIALIDEFYDRRVKVVIAASIPAQELYQGKRLAFEFDRTLSRLTEMHSLEYLAEPHRM